jgi:hypothetical protein
MRPIVRKTVIIVIPAMLITAFTFLALQYPSERRMMVLLIVFSTTLLTCTSVAGFFFLKLYAGAAISFGTDLKGRAIALVLAAVAFGISFGSGALLSYILSRV